MHKSSQKYSILIRYSIIIILSLFYKLFLIILSPLTLYLSFILISIFYPASISGSIILFNSHEISLIDPCISVLAYLLLVVFNLSVPMKPILRLKSLAFSLGIFWVFNVLRIVSLSLIFNYSPFLFNATHLFFWYFANILAVAIIWLLTVKIFGINSTPFYSDIKFLKKHSKR